MLIRTTTLALALALTAGCKKKDKDKPATEPQGSAAMKPSEPPKPEPPKPTPVTGEALAKRYQDCIGFANTGKLEEFQTECVVADYVGHEMDGEEMKGADSIIGFFKAMRAAMPDWKMEPQLVMVSGRNILAVDLMSGKHDNPLVMPGQPEIPATGKKVGLLFLHKLAVNDENKVTEEWVYSDPGTMMGQLGLLPKEAPPVRPAMEKGWEGAPIVVVPADTPAEKANIDVVNKSIAAINDKKIADAVALWSDDAVESDQAGDKDINGKKDLEKGLKEFLTAFPDIKIEATNTYAAGDYVILLGTMTGTHKGKLGPIKPTNKPVKSSFAEVIRVKDGKMTHVWRFRNSMAMAMQLGLMPSPEAPKGAAPAGEAPKK